MKIKRNVALDTCFRKISNILGFDSLNLAIFLESIPEFLIFASK